MVESLKTITLTRKLFFHSMQSIVSLQILQKYQIKYVGEELKLDYGVSVAPGNKMRFQFTPRQTQN